MEIQTIDKLIIKLGVFEDKCKDWRQTLELIKDHGSLGHHDRHLLEQMAGLIALNSKDLTERLLAAVEEITNKP